MRCSCGLRVAFTPETVRGASVFDDSYLIFVDCACGSTRNVTLWESEEQALYTEPRSDSYPAAAE